MDSETQTDESTVITEPEAIQEESIDTPVEEVLESSAEQPSEVEEQRVEEVETAKEADAEKEEREHLEAVREKEIEVELARERELHDEIVREKEVQAQRAAEEKDVQVVQKQAREAKIEAAKQETKTAKTQAEAAKNDAIRLSVTLPSWNKSVKTKLPKTPQKGISKKPVSQNFIEMVGTDLTNAALYPAMQIADTTTSLLTWSLRDTHRRRQKKIDNLTREDGSSRAILDLDGF